MQSLTTEVWISSRCLTTGHSVAEGSQHPFASSAVQQGPCRTATCLTLEHTCGRGLARDCGGSAHESSAERRLSRASRFPHGLASCFVSGQ